MEGGFEAFQEVRIFVALEGLFEFEEIGVEGGICQFFGGFEGEGAEVAAREFFSDQGACLAVFAAREAHHCFATGFLMLVLCACEEGLLEGGRIGVDLRTESKGRPVSDFLIWIV